MVCEFKLLLLPRGRLETALAGRVAQRRAPRDHDHIAQWRTIDRVDSAQGPILGVACCCATAAMPSARQSTLVMLWRTTLLFLFKVFIMAVDYAYRCIILSSKNTMNQQRTTVALARPWCVRRTWRTKAANAGCLSPRCIERIQGPSRSSSGMRTCGPESENAVRKEKPSAPRKWLAIASGMVPAVGP